MMKRFLLMSFLFAMSTTLFAAEANWLTSFQKAKEVAAKENKPIFMLFTGSTWCPPCKTLGKNLFSQKEFIEYANEKLVLLEVDFPDHAAIEEWNKNKRFPARVKMSGAQFMQNTELATQFKVEGFPTILLLDKEGKVIGNSDYSEFAQAKTPANYLKVLDKKLEKK